MNRRTSLLVTILIVVVVGIALIIGLAGSASNPDSCTTTGAAHTVTIRNGSVSDGQVRATRCDTLTVMNEDDVIRRVAFGEHDHHTIYDGVSDKVLGKGQSLTVTLDRTGDYHWHDHLHDGVEGYFTVVR